MLTLPFPLQGAFGDKFLFVAFNGKQRASQNQDQEWAVNGKFGDFGILKIGAFSEAESRY